MAASGFKVCREIYKLFLGQLSFVINNILLNNRIFLLKNMAEECQDILLQCEIEAFIENLEITNLEEFGTKK